MHQLRLVQAFNGFILVSTAFLLVVTFAGCSSHKQMTYNQKPETLEQEDASENASSPEEASENATVPKSLMAIGEAGEDAYDNAKAQDWNKLNADLMNLQKAEVGLNAEGKQLKQETAQLSQATQAKSQLKSMQVANQITLSAIHMSRAYKQSVPTEVSLLDYYGRELEIGALGRDDARLTKTKEDIEKTWDEIKPRVQQKGGKKEAEQFDGLTVRLQKDKSYSDYSHTAALILEQVDRLESVFIGK